MIKNINDIKNLTTAEMIHIKGGDGDDLRRAAARIITVITTIITTATATGK
jgi:hypothetical protein